MAHHLNYNEQTVKCGFFTVKEKAWHKLVVEAHMVFVSFARPF